MRRREHEAVLKATIEKYEGVLARQDDAIAHLREQNADLLNRCMATDWTAYTALSAEPQEFQLPPDMLYDPTGLIAVEADE